MTLENFAIGQRKRTILPILPLKCYNDTQNTIAKTFENSILL